MKEIIRKAAPLALAIVGGAAGVAIVSLIESVVPGIWIGKVADVYIAGAIGFAGAIVGLVIGLKISEKKAEKIA